MLEILNNEGNTIYYKCSCETKGCCMIRPLGEGSTIIVNIKCANCNNTERLTLIQYTDIKDKKHALSHLNDLNCSLAIVTSNTIL